MVGAVSVDPDDPVAVDPEDPDDVAPEPVSAVVSICGPFWVRPESERLAALPAPSVIVAELRLMAVAARAEVFCPAATV